MRKAQQGRKAGVRFQTDTFNAFKQFVETRDEGWIWRTTDRITYNPIKKRVFKQNTPQDLVFNHEILNLLIECKVVWDAKSFSFGRVPEEQEDNLEDYTRRVRGGLGVVAWSYYRPYHKGDLYIMPYWMLHRAPTRSFKIDTDPKDYLVLRLPRQNATWHITDKHLRWLADLRDHYE